MQRLYFICVLGDKQYNNNNTQFIIANMSLFGFPWKLEIGPYIYKS